MPSLHRAGGYGCGHGHDGRRGRACSAVMSDAQHAELMSVIALAAKTNHLANALQVLLDAVFDAGR